MPEIALHLLDLVQNSIQAGAQLVEIILRLGADLLLTMIIRDDGRGMDGETAQQVLSPFTTSRTTRKVGLGIPLTREAALVTGGSFHLQSTPGKGAEVQAVFDTRHIDCPPLGKLADTLASLILANPDGPDFTICLARGEEEHSLSTCQMKDTLGPVPINDPDVAQWLTSVLDDMANHTLGGIAS